MCCPNCIIHIIYSIAPIRTVTSEPSFCSICFPLARRTVGSLLPRHLRGVHCFEIIRTLSQIHLHATPTHVAAIKAANSHGKRSCSAHALHRSNYLSIPTHIISITPLASHTGTGYYDAARGAHLGSIEEEICPIAIHPPSSAMSQSLRQSRWTKKLFIANMEDVGAPRRTSIGIATSASNCQLLPTTHSS